ncbi:MAG TPA: hypothetical protein VMM84_20160 [Pyrinomonadaceae bacterium]|nr:hypothetical protein [Pyrinomonadaceae bacterium]
MAEPKKRKATRKRATKTAPPQSAISERLEQYASGLDLPRERKRPRLLSLLFCDFTNSTADLKINLLGIFDRIVVHPEINQSPAFVVFGRSAETYDDVLWLTVFDPDNHPAAEVKFDPPTQKALNRSPDKDIEYPTQVQFLLPLTMRFKKEGTYWFDISYEGKSLGCAGLVVEHKDIGVQRSGTDTFI